MISFLDPSNTRNTEPTERTSRSTNLARQIHDRLRGAGYLALHDVVCEVSDGVAFLNGRLRSYYLKQIAQAIAWEVDGIGWVENRIEVIPRSVGEERRRFGGLVDQVAC